MKYLAVIYLKNGQTCLSKPFDEQEEAWAYLKEKFEVIDLSKVEATTLIKRQDEAFASGYLFGHPAKWDLMQDKKFLREIGRDE